MEENLSFISESSDYDSDSNSTLHSIPAGRISVVCGVVMIFIALIGVLGNIMTATVFGLPRLTTSSPLMSLSTLGQYSSRRKRSSGGSMAPSTTGSFSTSVGRRFKWSSISILVTGLAVTDAMLLSLSCPLFASSAFMAYSPTLSMMNVVSYMTVYIYPLASTFQTVSVWTLSVITIERYVAVGWPFLARAFCTPARAIVAFCSIFIVSAIYNAPRFWEYTLHRFEAADDPSVVLIISVPALRVDPRYMKIYGHWMYFFFMFALPFTIVVFFNGAVIRSVQAAKIRREALSRQQTKEQGTAVMMVLVAVVFVVCNLLAFLLNALEVFGVSGAYKLALPGDSAQETPPGETVRHSSIFYLLVDFNNLLVMTHCSINFFVYYNFSQRFRLGCFHIWSRCACSRLIWGRKLDAVLEEGLGVEGTGLMGQHDTESMQTTPNLYNGALNGRRRSSTARRGSRYYTGYAQVNCDTSNSISLNGHLNLEQLKLRKISMV